jgi:hypothetical protein
MSETTRNMLAADLEVIDHEPLILKGMTEKQPIYQLQMVVMQEADSGV